MELFGLSLSSCFAPHFLLQYLVAHHSSGIVRILLKDSECFWTSFQLLAMVPPRLTECLSVVSHVGRIQFALESASISWTLKCSPQQYCTAKAPHNTCLLSSNACKTEC